jgi:hypothetical protein
MGARHVVFDHSLALFDATACTGWTFGSTYPSSVIDLGLYPDLVNPPEILIDCPGLGSAGALTWQTIIYGGTTASAATTVLWTSRTYTLAEAILMFDTHEWYRLPVPIGDFTTGTTQIRSLKLGIAIGTATPNGGTMYAFLGSPQR